MMKRGLESEHGEKRLIFLNGSADSKLIGRIEYVDMSQVQFITSSDVAQLIKKVKLELSKGKEVRLINVRDNVQRFIHKLGLKNILMIENMMN